MIKIQQIRLIQLSIGIGLCWAIAGVVSRASAETIIRKSKETLTPVEMNREDILKFTLLIGEFDFDEGMDGYVEILSEGSVGQVLADAIIFRRAEQ